MKPLLCLALIFMSGCASGPGGSGPSEAEINAESLKAYQEVKAKSKISKNAEWTAMVNRVAARIAKASGENFQWEWVLIEDPQVNAWCMPGGKIAVYTGIMPVMKTEAALAAVLGHEVAHATRRHGMQRLARAQSDQLLGLGVAAVSIVGGQLLCKSNTCKTLTGLGGAAAGFAINFFSLKFSRGEESEADHVGQEYMAKAGYDPSESIKLWERMGAANGGKAPPEWMSTHPSDENRRAELGQSLPRAQTFYSQANPQYGLGENIR